VRAKKKLRQLGGNRAGASDVEASEMPKTVAFVVAVAFALSVTTATGAAPKVTAIRLVSDGGFVARHDVIAVDARNRAALARTAALVPARLPRLPPLESGCMDCILNTLTIVRGGRRFELRWYNGAPSSLRPLLAALAKNGRHVVEHTR
jgi:hypothetical protein